MTVFPMFLVSKGQNCLVVGGGPIALQKLQVLLPGKFRITVVAPEVMPEIRNLPVELHLRKVQENDVDKVSMVVDATGNPEVGVWLREICSRKKTLLNVVDCAALCDFTFPAMLHRGKLTAAISTAGASPIAARWVRDRVAEILPDAFEEILDQLEELRPLTRQRIDTQSRRAAFLKKCFDRAMEQGRALSDKELNELWMQI